MGLGLISKRHHRPALAAAAAAAADADTATDARCGYILNHNGIITPKFDPEFKGKS